SAPPRFASMTRRVSPATPRSGSASASMYSSIVACFAVRASLSRPLRPEPRRSLQMLRRERAHRHVVRELDDRAFRAGFEHRVDTGGRDARDDSKLGYRCFTAATAAASEPRDGCQTSPTSSARRIAAGELPPTQISGQFVGTGPNVAPW